MPSAEGPAEKDGLVPADLAVLPPSDAGAALRYALLWCEPAQGEERRLIAAASEQEFLAAGSALAQQGFAAQLTVGVWADERGQRRYLGIWSNLGPACECRPAYTGYERFDKPQSDLAGVPAAELADPLDAFRAQLAEIEKLPADQSDQPQMRLSRAVARYHLGELEAALAGLDDLVAEGGGAVDEPSGDGEPPDTNPPRQQAAAPAVSPLVFQFRDWTLARLGRDEEARAELSRYLERIREKSTRAYARIVLAALLGEFDEALGELDSAAEAGASNVDALYNAGCAAAVAGQALATADAQRAGALLDRAIELLSSAVERGYRDARQLRSDIDLAALRDDPRFLAIIDRLSPPARVAGVWSGSTEVESRLVGPVSVDDHLRHARELAAQGYRPVAIMGDVGSVAELARVGGVGAEPAGILTNSATGDGPLVWSVWQRPLVPRADRLELARRQAAAAAALARMGERAEVLAALRVDSGGESRGGNPERRTQFMHGSKARGVTAAELLECIELADRARRANPPRQQGSSADAHTNPQRQDSDAILYGLLLSLGEFDMGELPAERREAFVAQLAGWYANDLSSGIHGAAGWLLRQWKQDDVVTRVDETPLAYSPDREWFTLEFSGAAGGTNPPRQQGVNATEGDASPVAHPPPPGTFHMTFIVFPPGEYLIGSPLDEPNRSADKPLQRVTLTRPFAMADRELTWEQIAGFDRSIGFDRRAGWERQFGKKLTLDMPAFGVTWYGAVAYCRWLTQVAGMSEEDQAYADRKALDPKQFPPDPDPNAGGAPKNWPLDLNKAGFRLPTEAEWEVACRCGMSTAYSFGDDRQMLGRYGWFQENSSEWSHAVVQLRPGPRGLFDMHGNLYEWCHDWYATDQVDGATAADPLGPLEGASRVVRGGSWTGVAARCRAARRDVIRPAGRDDYLGLRVLLVPFSESSVQGSKP